MENESRKYKRNWNKTFWSELKFDQFDQKSVRRSEPKTPNPHSKYETKAAGALAKGSWVKSNFIIH